MPRTLASLTRPSAGTVFGLAWPLTFKALMLHGIVVIDTYLVSSLGESAVAVLGLSASIAGLLLGLLVAFSNATQIRTAQAYGSDDRVFLKSALLAGLTINLAVVLVGLLVLALIAGPIIDGLAHDDWIATQARRYLSVFALVIFAEAIGQCLTSFFNGCGDTRMPALSYLLAVPVNIASSIVLIHGLFGLPEFGVVGAAMGSALASLLQVGFLVLRLLSRRGDLLRLPGWRNGSFAATLRRHLGFALPIAATFGSATIAMSVCGLIYARLPVIEFAAMTIIMPWVQVAGTIGMSWAQATGIIVAQLLGRATPEEQLDAFLAEAWRVALIAAALVAVFYAGVCLSTPWIYADLHADTRATLLGFLPILLVLPFPKGSNAICGNTLRAGGETVYVMHIFVWSQWLFRVPATALMVLWLDLPVTWVFSLLLAEELVKFAPFHLRLRKGRWKEGALDD
ncbi:MATE family efflux transporter [Maliponia aquimaris]|uniref:Multidrug resistance protein MdtK n=1 Tax=Maliponia aquimaris TaxID=1673631 RepID=A0A238K881_9RHOB|nr:MATE family efflux transporter [Maliponia aquimaris]SMX39090.1 Multidrug resistance protein MdtK [Maliponia aquimaris]